jgi:hypothetical protein
VGQISCGEPRPPWMSLSCVRVIMTFMHILVVELLYKTAMGRISALECLLRGRCGGLWLRLVLFDIK